MRGNFNSYLDIPFGDPFGGVPYGEYNDPVTATVAGAGAAANIAGGIFGKGSAKKAARAQQAAAQAAQQALTDNTNKANEALYQSYDKGRGDLLPWLDNGTGAINQLGYGLGLSDNGTGVKGDLLRNFGASDFQVDPGYQFVMDQGQRGIQNSAAAGGGLLSGATLKALTRFNQDTASNQYQNSYNRFNQNKQQQLNSLFNMAGVGQQAAGMIGQYGMNTGNAVSNNLTSLGANAANLIKGAGDAKAAGIMGGANAITQGIGGALNFAGGMASIPGVLPGTAPQTSIGSYTPFNPNQYQFLGTNQSAGGLGTLSGLGAVANRASSYIPFA